jgi:glycosyltransferase involved in cell wall biosynthesis
MFSTAKSFHHVPYGISTTDYYPMDRLEARARLRIDPDVMLVCFGAMDIKNQRKGTAQLLRALETIADLPNVEGLVFGSGRLPQTSTPLPRIHEVGPVVGRLQQRAVYSASNVFVLPSLEDNLPLTGLEAMACGIPIVGFDAGGIPDYVRPSQTGLLARTGDADDLGRKLRTLTTEPDRVEAMGRAARNMIERQYDGRREATAYQRLYESLIESARPVFRAAA